MMYWKCNFLFEISRGEKQLQRPRQAGETLGLANFLSADGVLPKVMPVGKDGLEVYVIHKKYMKR
eukprot:UN19973